jgi:hypothetical protein
VSEFKVFLSSTREDLVNFRETVRNKLVGLHQPLFAMEDMGSNPADAVAVSSDQVSECDLFIGVYAYRYGYVPDGDDKSITEQEYDLARSLGKRCLCYVAAESLKPEIIREDPSKQERLAAFKQRIGIELVRNIFNSPDDLREKVGDDVERLLRGDPLGYTHKDVQERWLKWEGLTRKRMFKEELNNPPITIDSPLKSSFTGFINTPGWHEVLGERLNNILDYIREFPGEAHDFPLIAEIAELNLNIDLNEDYLVVDDAIKPLLTRMEGIQQLIIQLKKAQEAPMVSAEDRHLAAHRLNCVYDLRHQLFDLRDSVKTRDFAKVFPILGELGSGKTYFLASLLETHLQGLDYDYLVLPLERSPFAESLETMILRRIREATGMQWRSLEEFDRFLDLRYPLPDLDQPESQIKLIIVLDDFQKGIFKSETFKDDRDELIKFISHNTKLHSLHWIILLQDTFYLEVAEKTQSWFWEEYSFTSPDSKGQEKVGQWLSLNELNRSERTGLELIRRSLDSLTEEDSLALDRVKDDPYTLNNLSSPFIAGVLLDLREQLPLTSLVDLNFIEFVTHFWEKRFASLDTGSLNADLLKLSVGLIARSLLNRESHPTLTDMLDDVTGAAEKVKAELKNRDKAELALDILKHANLLAVEGIPDPDLGDYPVQRITIRFETFWEWNIARQLRVTQSLKQGDSEAAEKELQKWFSGDQAQDIKAGVFTFLLLLLDQDAKANKTTPDFIEFILRLGLSSQDLLAVGVWFAGPKASPLLQNSLARLANEQTHHYDEPRALFGFMYFMAECLIEALDEPSRLKLLQPYFELIDKASLADYYKYITERLCRNAENDEIILACMPYLSGCEVLGITDDLAEITLYSTDGGPEATFNFVIQYLKANAESIEQEFKHRHKPVKGARYFYWEWVLCIFCRSLVDEMDLDAYEFLAQNNWYKAENFPLEYPISLRMRQEANLALGFWYRTQRRKEKDQYIDLIYRLVNSPDIIKRETAFYFIRHTKTYEREKALPVDKVFHPALAQIFLDPQMHGIVDSHLETFKINLDDFEKLNHQRTGKS